MNINTSPHDENIHKSNFEWKKHLLLIQGTVLFFTSIIISGYRIYSANQTVQIPFILSLSNPNLFPNDPFISTFVHYIAHIYRLIAFLSNSIPLETLLLIFFLLTRALVLFAAARLALTLSNNSKLAAVGAMAFFALFPAPIIGHGTLVNNYFEHTSLSVAVLLLAIAAFYSSRSFFWALLLAIGFNLNIMYGTYVCVYLAAVFLFDRHYHASWKKWLLPGILFLLLSAPTIASALSSLSSETQNQALWLRVSQIRMPYHFYPLSWEPYRFNLFFAFGFFSSLVLYLARKENRWLFKHGMIWLGVSLLWLGYAFTAAYITKSPAMLIMHPARGTDLWFIFASISVIAALANLTKTKFNISRFYVVLFFVSVFWAVLFEHTLFMEFIFLFLTIAVIWEPAWRSVMKDGEDIRLSNLTILIAILIGTFAFSRQFYSERTISITRYPGSQIQEIANWAKENSSIEDVFLVDPNWNEFRALSKRPVFVTWKDGTAMLWQRDYLQEWVPRIESLGFDFSDTDKSGEPDGFPYISRLYKKLNDAQVNRITTVYPVRFWVVSIEHPTSFPVVYESSGFKVLDLNP
jgi:hypothetical protein